VLTDLESKKEYFNRYWRTRDLYSADARSNQRAQYVLDLLGELQGGKALDVGCGRGLIMDRLQDAGFDVCGCDLSNETINRLASEGRDVFLCDIERDDIPGKYDIVLCLEVLQQVFDPMQVVEKMKSALTENGRLIISVPNELHLLSRLKLLVGRSHLGHFEESHIRLFAPRRAAQLFERTGLETEKVISVPVVPPRMKKLTGIGRFLAGANPNLFSLSQIYRLRKK